ncbi:MAG: PLP-dependent aspartate aminotransferase family protein [Actinomycetes bacterium]
MVAPDSREPIDFSHDDTIAVHGGRPPRVADGPINQPIVASSTLHAGGPFGYHREFNETLHALEDLIGQLEGGTAVTFSSGMAAANAVFDLFRPQSVIVASKFSYTGVSVRLRELAADGRIELRLVDITDIDAMQEAINRDGKSASWVWIESPTNPMIEIGDIRATAQLCHEVGARLVVDNTFMTPARQKPLGLGAHVVMHSVTKGLSGHSDLLMGALVTADHELAEEFLMRRVLLGAVPSAFDGFLAIRGIRTLNVRIDRAEHNAQILAERLQEHPSVRVVHYPGLPGHKNAAVAKDQTSGPGTVLSFETIGGPDDAQRVCESVTLMSHATSLGGVETLLERRRRWPSENPDIPETLIRLSCGIENVEDLWTDLRTALDLLR